MCFNGKIIHEIDKPVQMQYVCHRQTLTTYNTRTSFRLVTYKPHLSKPNESQLIVSDNYVNTTGRIQVIVTEKQKVSGLH